MKDSTSLLLLAGAVMLTGVLANFATADASSPAAPARQEAVATLDTRASVRGAYDLDQDGRLDRAERSALRADVAAGKVTAPWLHRHLEKSRRSPAARRAAAMNS